MSDDLDFEMEVVEEDGLDELGAGGASSSEKDFSSEVGKEEEEIAWEDDSEEKVRKTGEIKSSNSVESSESEAEDSKKATRKHLTDPGATQLERDAFGGLPSDWEYVQTGENLEYIRSGISQSQNQDGKGFPVTRIETIADGSVNYEKVGYVEADPEEANSDRLKSGDLLFSNINSREQIGKTAFYGGEEPLYHGMNLLRLRYQEEVIHPLFAYYLYDSPMAKDIFFRLSQAAVGQSSINQGQLKNLSLPRPPLPEQCKIASVLYAVDQAIQKTGAIIEQAKRVKRGLMQDFFRTGLVKDRDLEETRIGEIPADWTVINAGEHLNLVSGAHVKAEHVTTDKSLEPYITGPEDFDLRSIEVSKYTDQPSKFCEPGDILVTVKGSGCGKTAIADRRVCISRQLKALQTDESLNRDFLFYYLRLNQDLMEALSEGSAIPGLSNSHLLKFDVPLPPEEEQRKIGGRLASVDDLIENNLEYVSRLKEIKKGLMQDLLTGEVRTADKAIEVLDEVAAHG